MNVADFLLDLAQGEVARTQHAGGAAAPGSGPVGAVVVAGANGTAGGKGRGEEEEGGSEGGLTGPAAIKALWASYEEFHK